MLFTEKCRIEYYLTPTEIEKLAKCERVLHDRFQINNVSFAILLSSSYKYADKCHVCLHCVNGLTFRMVVHLTCKNGRTDLTYTYLLHI